jgi:hypothetical protein
LRELCELIRAWFKNKLDAAGISSNLVERALLKALPFVDEANMIANLFNFFQPMGADQYRGPVLGDK